MMQLMSKASIIHNTWCNKVHSCGYLMFLFEVFK